MCRSVTERERDGLSRLLPEAALPSPSAEHAGSHDASSSLFSMDLLDLEAPIATIRALGGIGPNPASGSHGRTARVNAYASFDPVARSIVSEVDAQKLVDLSVKSCFTLLQIRQDFVLICVTVSSSIAMAWPCC